MAAPRRCALATNAGETTMLIWGMDVWVFVAFALTYISLIFSLVYGFWPRKDEQEDEEEP